MKKRCLFILAAIMLTVPVVTLAEPTTNMQNNMSVDRHMENLHSGEIKDTSKAESKAGAKTAAPKQHKKSRAKKAESKKQVKASAKKAEYRQPVESDKKAVDRPNHLNPGEPMSK